MIWYESPYWLTQNEHKIACDDCKILEDWISRRNSVVDAGVHDPMPSVDTISPSSSSQSQDHSLQNFRLTHRTEVCVDGLYCNTIGSNESTTDVWWPFVGWDSDFCCFFNYCFTFLKHIGEGRKQTVLNFVLLIVFDLEEREIAAAARLGDASMQFHRAVNSSRRHENIEVWVAGATCETAFNQWGKSPCVSLRAIPLMEFLHFLGWIRQCMRRDAKDDDFLWADFDIFCLHNNHLESSNYLFPWTSLHSVEVYNGLIASETMITRNSARADGRQNRCRVGQCGQSKDRTHDYTSSSRFRGCFYGKSHSVQHPICIIELLKGHTTTWLTELKKKGIVPVIDGWQTIGYINLYPKIDLSEYW